MTATSAYDHGAILDNARLGNPPSEHYLERVDMLDNVVRECMYISKGYAGIQSSTPRHFYASVLFTALITRGVSLAQLMPFTPWAEKRIEHWDYASAAGITRTMLELRIAFFYLCVDSCSEEEWLCRWNLFNLHDCVSRIRLFDAIGDKPQADAFASQVDELRGRLSLNTYFQSLAAGQQRKLLNGQAAYLSTLEEIAERDGIERSTFRWFYIFLSSHVHSLPMSFYRLGDGDQERGRGLPSPVEEGYTSMCLSLASTFLVSTRDDVHELFSEFKSQAAEKIREETSPSLDDEVAVSANGLPTGETRMLAETDDVQIEATRTAEDAIELVYRHKDTGNVVLRRSESEEHGTELEYFDPIFWNVRVNGKLATEQQLEALKTEQWAYKADHLSCILSFKIGT